MFDFFDPAVILNRIIYLTPAVIIGLTFHEYAHAAAAYRLGDKTAHYQGRLTLNPAAHIDVMGIIMLYVLQFGWAKPVPVNPNNLRGDKKRGMLLVSLAGPVTNILIAFIAAVLYGALLWKIPHVNTMTDLIIKINVILAIFNLLPLPPLDGSKILVGLLPGNQEWFYSLEQYGAIILIALLFTGIIGKVLSIFITPILGFLYWLANTVNLLL